MRTMFTSAIVAAITAAATYLTPAADANPVVYEQIGCALGTSWVSLNYRTSSGGSARIDGPIGGRGWQCRTFRTSREGYMRISASQAGVVVSCEIRRNGKTLVKRESGRFGTGAIACYIVPSTGE